MADASGNFDDLVRALPARLAPRPVGAHGRRETLFYYRQIAPARGAMTDRAGRWVTLTLCRKPPRWPIRSNWFVWPTTLAPRPSADKLLIGPYEVDQAGTGKARARRSHACSSPAPGILTVHLSVGKDAG